MPATELPRRRTVPAVRPSLQQDRIRDRGRLAPPGYAPRTSTPLPGREVWEEYRARPSVERRNAIIEAYVPLLRRLALRISQKLPAQVDVDDLVSAGSFGLMDAIERYDPSREASFATFCAKRIHGAIMDHLRSMDWSARLTRKREAAVAAACDSYRKEFGRAPTTDEIIERLGVGEDRGRRILGDSRVVAIGSLSQERVRPGGDHGLRPEETIGDNRQDTGLTAAAHRDLKEFITRRLSRAERLLVILYYYEGLKMHEVGQTLGLSESRISQMRTTVLAKLRVQLHGRGEAAMGVE